MAKNHDPAQALNDALNRIAAHPDSGDPTLLRDLVRALRPRHYRHSHEARQRLESLIALLEAAPEQRQGLRRHLLWLLTEKRQTRLLTETGILGNEGFISALWSRLSQRLLPEAVDDDSLHDHLAAALEQESDYIWLSAIPDDLWQRLLSTLDFTAEADEARYRQRHDGLLHALEVLSLRIAGTALEPEFVRNHPDIEYFESAFITQGQHVRAFIEAHQQARQNGCPPEDDEKHILVLLDQCESILDRIRRQARKQGTSIGLTWHMARLRQQIDRLKQLLALLSPQRDADDIGPELNLLRDITRALCRRHALSEVYTATTDLLARQVTDHAAHTGEHYRVSDRSGWWRMLRAALGAGVIVGFMAMIKLLIGGLHMPPLPEAFLFSLNYAAGFVLVHLLGFTIATKQPAMTAQAIAAAVPEKRSERELDALQETILQTLRGQFAAILGNVVMALPVACLIVLGLHYAFGIQGLPSAEKSAHLLHELNPLTSLALLHAGIAGVFLFLTGLISGYFDNKAVYRRIPERLRQHPGLRRCFGKRATQRLGDYAEHNLGAIVGNTALGFMLGSAGAIGAILGLPIDIRHVTFASANLGLVLGGDLTLAWPVLLVSMAGILLIGLVNLAVSFALALVVARKSRGLRFLPTRLLLGRLWAYARRHPLALFFPPGTRHETET